MSNLSVEQALREADRCVKCGLCLPQCPTYRLYADENESPRGRIALAEALLRGQFGESERLVDHLYHCLLCRRCEITCPSGVKYSQLIDAARARVPRPHWSMQVTSHPKTARLLGRLAHAVPLPGSQLSALARALPDAAAPTPGRYPAEGELRGKVHLFLGCVTSQYQGSALNAAVAVLTRLGYAVVIPGKQGCCGALAQHQGDPDSASRQVDTNREAFRGAETLVSIASGCSAQLVETLGQDLQVRDMVTFLRQVLSEYPLAIPALDADVALHLPCSSVNVLRNSDDSVWLLQQIPGLRVQPLASPGACCGAAGDHLLTQRAQAEALRRPLLEQLLRQRPRYLVTSNVGCALHLAEGAKKQGLQLEVIHPVELLAQLLAN